MKNEKDIIEFESLFKEQPKDKNPYPQPENNGRYSAAIIYYLLIMFVVASVFYIIFNNIPSFEKTYSENELVLENIAFDSQGLALMSTTDYAIFSEVYEDYIIEIGEYEGFQILANIDNDLYDDIFYKTDDLSGELVLDTDKIELVFGLNPTITTWDNIDLTIHIYAGKTQYLPTFFEADYEEITGPITELSDFGSAFINFSIYVVLLPGLLLILKQDFIYDFNQIKTKKNQWFSIVIIGYLYLMLGNIISNYASAFIGDLFKLTPVDAVNQITILRALNSSGAIFMILSAVILGPIAEELIFRKAFFSLIRSDKWALIISSLIFGSVHLIGEANIIAALVNGLSYYVMGFIFGYIYLKNNKNVFAPIAVHILSNAVSIVAIIFVL